MDLDGASDDGGADKNENEIEVPDDQDEEMSGEAVIPKQVKFEKLPSEEEVV